MSAATNPSDPTRKRAKWDSVIRALMHAIVALFVLQVSSGLLLLTAYVPASTTAWGSVWYIQTQIPQGWLIRGLHVTATDALIVLIVVYLALWLLGSLVESAPKWHWWTALALLGFVVAFALTGYLLPYDQRAYWGTVVRTNILAHTPYVGDGLKRLLLAGDAPGTMALTRFHALHVAFLPILLVLFWKYTRSYLRKGDGMAKRRERGDQSAAMPIGAVLEHRNEGGHAALEPTPGGTDSGYSFALGRALIRMATALTLVLWVIFRHYYLGRNDLDAPADPSALDYPARPEWWALPLFQWLKFFPTPAGETFAAIIVPGALAGILILLPLVPKKMLTRGFHRWVMRGAALLMTLAAGLTAQALWIDWRPDSAYRLARGRADREADRANALAHEQGIPPQGAPALLQNDHFTRGPKLFAANCASCHRVHGHNGLGETPSESANSSDLGGFATQPWIRGLLADPMQTRYFGLMKNPEGEPAHTKMREWIAEQMEANVDPDSRAKLGRDFDAAAAYLADEAIQPGRFAGLDISSIGESETDPRRFGRRVFMQTCNECHSYQEQRTGTTIAPEMYGYGSPDWLELMIASPDHELRYRAKGRQRAQMPPFRDRLSRSDNRLLAEWLAVSQEIQHQADSSKSK